MRKLNSFRVAGNLSADAPCSIYEVRVLLWNLSIAILCEIPHTIYFPAKKASHLMIIVFDAEAHSEQSSAWRLRTDDKNSFQSLFLRTTDQAITGTYRNTCVLYTYMRPQNPYSIWLPQFYRNIILFLLRFRLFRSSFSLLWQSTTTLAYLFSVKNGLSLFCLWVENWYLISRYLQLPPLCRRTDKTILYSINFYYPS